LTDFTMFFLLVVTCFLAFSKLRMWILNYTQEDTFMPYFMQIGRAAWTNSLDKKDKSTASYNITRNFAKLHFYKNGNIIIILLKITVFLWYFYCVSLITWNLKHLMSISPILVWLVPAFTNFGLNYQNISYYCWKTSTILLLILKAISIY